MSGPHHHSRRSRRLQFLLPGALLSVATFWLFLFRVYGGFQMQVGGLAAAAARYAGFSSRRALWVALLISGGMAGLAGAFEVAGPIGQLTPYVPAGYGFAGIAVALMGRSHPLGIVLAALLFGALQQGGAELAFDIPTITREMVVVIQGLIILFSGALAHLPRPWLQSLLALKG